MDVWETIVSGSTIPSGDFWEHLSSQGGGGGGSTTIIISATVESDVEESLTAEVSVEEYSATVTEETITAEATQELEAEVDDPVLTADAIISIG